MNLYATAEFARAMGRVEGVEVAPCVVSCDGRRYATVAAAGRPIVDRVWLDYLEEAEGPADHSVRYLPRAVKGTVSERMWHDELASTAKQRSLQAAPLIDFTAFASWEEVESWFRRNRSSHLKTLQRQARRIERELGELQFDPADRDEAAFDRLIMWKRAHYARTAVGDPLAVPANLAMFSNLHRSGALELATLRAAGRLLAVIAVVRIDGRLFYWMPSYDIEHATLSTGTVLLNRLMRQSYEAGDHEFDFMLGDESYKWQYATHCRLIGPAGSVPVARRVRRLAGQAKRRLVAATNPSPQAP